MILNYKLFENQINDDIVICTDNIDGLPSRNHLGYIRKNGIEFLNRFSDRLHGLDGVIKNKNGWFVDNSNIIPFDNNKKGDNIPLIYSNKFKKLISYNLKFLLDYENIYYSDVSFISISDRNDTVSCLSNVNYEKLVDKKTVWTTNLRQNIRFGRFIKKIISLESPKNIEDYINDYKFSFNVIKSNVGTFKKISGDDLKKWYLEKNYAIGGGSLNGSCMRYEKSQKRLPIYTENVEKIRLLIIINNDGKLVGRALLWKLDEPEGAFYMDRVYTTSDYFAKFFYDYARRMNFLTKDFVDKNNITLKVKIRRDFGPPTINPFMDTFKFFIKKGNYLTNKFMNFKAGDYYEYINHD